MNRQNTRFSGAATLVVLLLIGVARADLVVVYDSGRSWSMDRYLLPIRPQHAPGPASADAPQHEPGLLDLATLLPMRSPGLSPGRVEPRDFKTPMPLALFMLGSDPVSLRWLEQHRDYLKAQGAIGLLVEADNEEQVTAVADTAGGLPITLASGVDMARLLAIEHYPVAVTEGRLWQ